MQPIDDIMGHLRERLRQAGARNWKALAVAINDAFPPTSDRDAIGEPLLRKIAYGDRDNPGVETVQPILRFLAAVDRGELAMPTDERRAA